VKLAALTRGRWSRSRVGGACGGGRAQRDRRASASAADAATRLKPSALELEDVRGVCCCGGEKSAALELEHQVAELDDFPLPRPGSVGDLSP
jgi:hypothetical protein